MVVFGEITRSLSQTIPFIIMYSRAHVSPISIVGNAKFMSCISGASVSILDTSGYIPDVETMQRPLLENEYDSQYLPVLGTENTMES